MGELIDFEEAARKILDKEHMKVVAQNVREGMENALDTLEQSQDLYNIGSLAFDILGGVHPDENDVDSIHHWCIVLSTDFCDDEAHFNILGMLESMVGFLRYEFRSEIDILTTIMEIREHDGDLLILINGEMAKQAGIETDRIADGARSVWAFMGGGSDVIISDQASFLPHETPLISKTRQAARDAMLILQFSEMIQTVY